MTTLVPSTSQNVACWAPSGLSWCTPIAEYSPAGTVTFSIQPGASQAATGRRPLSPEEMYARAELGFPNKEFLI